MDKYKNQDLIKQAPEILTKYNLWPDAAKSPNSLPLLVNNLDKLDVFGWKHFSSNPEYVDYLLENHYNDINWLGFNENTSPKAIEYLRNNPEKINYYSLSWNPSAVLLLMDNFEKIDWNHFCLNRNPDIVPVLRQNLDKINWYYLSMNPAAIELLKEYPDKVDIGALDLIANSNLDAKQLLEELLIKRPYDFYAKRVLFYRSGQYKPSIGLLEQIKKMADYNKWRDLILDGVLLEI